MSSDTKRKEFAAGSGISAGHLNAMSRASLQARGVGGASVHYDQIGRMVIDMGAMLPPGFIFDYAGIIDTDHPVPKGWFLCDGSTRPRTDRLFRVVGTTYGTGDGSTTYNLPDFRQIYRVGAGTRAAATVDPYALADEFGFNWHGQTENNHFDHSFLLDLYHTHPVALPSATICDGPDTGGVCDFGSRTVAGYTGTQATDGPGSGSWGADSKVPAAGSADATQGSISRNDDEFTVTLKHKGWEDLATNSGDSADDTDNRPPSMAVWVLIKA